VVNTIAATATATALTVTAVLDAGRYPVGAEITDAQMKQLEDRVIARHGFHGDWNLCVTGHRFHYAAEPLMSDQ